VHMDEAPAEASKEKLRLAIDLQRLEGRLLADDLATRLGFSIRHKYDINLATLGDQWLGVSRGISDFTLLSVGIGEDSVLMGALAYSLRSSLDRLFTNSARLAHARIRTPAQLGRRLTLSFGGGAPPGRRGVNW
jgi:hypothetical protein